MAVHDALHRTVTGRHEARKDHQEAVERMAAEIVEQRDRDALDVPADATETAAPTRGAHDGDPG